MKVYAAKNITPSINTSRRSGTRQVPDFSSNRLPTLSNRNSIRQRKPACVCGGGCPRCDPSLQPKRIISRSSDKYEQDADRTADAVTGVAEPFVKHKSGSVREEFLEAGRLPNRKLNIPANPGSSIEAVQGGGQYLPGSMRAFFESRLGYDFGQVRIHTGVRAVQSAKALNARAFTVGNDIVFGAGQYAPESKPGSWLLAHELVHVSQGRPDRIMRKGFGSEDAVHRKRRLAAISKAHIVINRLIKALSRGYIWSISEKVNKGGVYLYSLAVEETRARRESRLKQMITDLIKMVIELEKAPIPQPWLKPEVKTKGQTLIAGSHDPALTDVTMFYAHRANGLGVDPDTFGLNTEYILSSPDPKSVIKRAKISRTGVPTGIYIHVPDPENKPLVYQRLTGKEGWQKGGVVLDVMSDDFGYYYIYNGKHYLPRKP